MGVEAADPADDDLADALALATPDMTGASLWRPARLEDITGLPWRVMPLLGAIQAGIVARREPWGWWQRGDSRVLQRSHLYAATLAGEPSGAARCGYDPGADPRAAPYGWSRPPDLSRTCPACDRLAGGRAQEAST